MKRARLVLAATAIVAIVSATSAFRAKDAYSAVIYTGNLPNNCPTRTFATTCAGGPQIYYSTMAGSSTCTPTCTVADSN